MGMPAARITDMHLCPMVTPGLPPIPHVGGPISLGSPTVLTGKLPQARVTDLCVCVGPPDAIVKGSAGVLVNKLPAARIGDLTAHGGAIVLGLPTVLIGETAGGGGGGGGGGAGAGSSGGAQAAAAAGGAGPGEASGEPAIAATDPGPMAKGMVESHKMGAPFCEVCFKAEQARKAAAMQNAAVSGTAAAAA